MSAAHLLADVARLGVRLEAHGDRLRYHPRSAVTPDLAERMKAHKAELLVLLRPMPHAVPAPPAATIDAPAMPPQTVCRCGSTRWRDVPIHGGQSVRHDCGRCGRFIDFPVWYGNDTLRNE
jgi:hypothetical protein